MVFHFSQLQCLIQNDDKPKTKKIQIEYKITKNNNNKNL